MICCNLKKEAKRACKDIDKLKGETKEMKGKDAKGKDKNALGKMKKISYNIRA